MKKAEQERINAMVDNFVDRFNNEQPELIKSKRLRSCKATVYIYKDFILLKSYRTMIAGIDRKTDTLYDFLRMTYGYTATSAQHIAKFDHDYCAGKWGCSARYTWRAC